MAWLTLALAPCGGLPAQDRGYVYLAANPGAALSLVNAGFVANSILPTVLFGQEAGLALALGCSTGSALLEGRVSVGNSNAYHLLIQTQVSANWRFAEDVGWAQAGPYLGLALRYWDLVQVHARIHSHNVASFVHLGWWLDLGRVFVDLRLAQVVAVASWSSLARSRASIRLTASPLPGVSPWLPIGLVQVGVRLGELR